MTQVEGEFSRGDVIAIRDADGREIARGLANYASAEARLLCRKPSGAFEQLLGYAAEPEMVHRRIYQLDAHLERMRRSAAGLYLAPPCTWERLREIIIEVAKAGGEDQQQDQQECAAQDSHDINIRVAILLWGTFMSIHMDDGKRP